MITHLTKAQFAERMGVCSRTIDRWKESGQGPRFISKGGVIRYRLADIEQWELDSLAQTSLQAFTQRFS